eukprot:NODE_188_length_13518_cov_0.721142.p9 type:complete len:207 gc:universal NODE_188_length_13518_cov_0.721142:5705-6325(+)
MSSVPVSIVLLGSGAVGKSSITTRFIRNSYSEQYDPTIEDSYVKKIKSEVDGRIYNVDIEITDTAGQENYRGLWGDKYLRTADAFILVFSVCELETLHELNSLANQVFNAKEDHKIPIVVVGNKRDLSSRQVTPIQGSSFTKQIANDATYFECSAKTGEGVSECFEQLVQHVILKKYPRRKSVGRLRNSTRKPSKKKKDFCGCVIM